MKKEKHRSWDTWAIGQMIRSMDMESSHMRMVINSQDSGHATMKMEKEYSHISRIRKAREDSILMDKFNKSTND